MKARRLGAVLMYLSMIVGVPACLGPSGQASDSEATSSETSDLAADPRAFTCNGSPPGLPLPINKEATFDTCVTTCVNNHSGTFGQCSAGCCFQIVHCSQCFIQ